MAAMSGITKVYKGTKVHGETLAEWKKEWDLLTDEDKAEMIAWAEAEAGDAAA